MRRLPAPSARWLRDSPLTQDALISNMEYVLGARRHQAVTESWQRSIATVRKTGARSRRCTGACSATTPPTRAGCAGNGSTGAIRTTRGGEPEIWIAREGPPIVGQYATMPVQAVGAGAGGRRGSWGMDVMVAPERQRQGLGEVLFRTWDRNVGASLGLGLSDVVVSAVPEAAWPDVGPVPCLVKPLTRRALRRPTWPVGRQPPRLGGDAAVRADRGAHAAARAPRCG